VLSRSWLGEGPASATNSLESSVAEAVFPGAGPAQGGGPVGGENDRYVPGIEQLADQLPTGQSGRALPAVFGQSDEGEDVGHPLAPLIGVGAAGSTPSLKIPARHGQATTPLSLAPTERTGIGLSLHGRSRGCSEPHQLDGCRGGYRLIQVVYWSWDDLSGWTI